MLTNKKINELIKCPKIIIEATPKNGMAADKQSSLIMRKNLKLQSKEEQHLFDVFIRHNTKFIEQFSIGLLFKTNDKTVGKITLIRYNGEHGQNDWSRENHYSAFHIHKISEKLLKAGIYEPKDIKITQQFSTFDSAMNEFLRHLHIVNYAKYFPHHDEQMLLFEG